MGSRARRVITRTLVPLAVLAGLVAMHGLSDDQMMLASRDASVGMAKAMGGAPDALTVARSAGSDVDAHADSVMPAGMSHGMCLTILTALLLFLLSRSAGYQTRRERLGGAPSPNASYLAPKPRPPLPSKLCVLRI